LGNEKIRKLANEVRAARAVVARRAINFGKVCVAKAMCWGC